MSIIIKEATTSSELKRFANLPYKLYKNHPFWVPQIKSDEHKSLLPEHNPAFEFCKTKFWLAYRDGKCVGRIGGIINPLLIEKSGEKIARFTRAEFVDDEKVADGLFSEVEGCIVHRSDLSGRNSVSIFTWNEEPAVWRVERMRQDVLLAQVSAQVVVCVVRERADGGAALLVDVLGEKLHDEIVAPVVPAFSTR